MYEFWYDCVKPKYEEKARLCYIDIDNFLVYIKTEDSLETMQKPIMTTDDKIRDEKLQYVINRGRIKVVSSDKLHKKLLIKKCLKIIFKGSFDERI